MEVKGRGKGHINLAKAEVTSVKKQVIAGHMTVGQITLFSLLCAFSLSLFQVNHLKSPRRKRLHLILRETFCSFLPAGVRFVLTAFV